MKWLKFSKRDFVVWNVSSQITLLQILAGVAVWEWATINAPAVTQALTDAWKGLCVAGVFLKNAIIAAFVVLFSGTPG